MQTNTKVLSDRHASDCYVNHFSLLCLPDQDEKQRFTSVLLLARLLAKFLGFISFLPYQTSERPSREIQEAAIALRSKVGKLYKHTLVICV